MSAGQHITLEIVDGPDYARDEQGWEHHRYEVELRRGEVSIGVPWLAGLGITEDPTASDVLKALLLDASGVENARGSFEEWAGEYGYDPDSRRAEELFRAVTRQTDLLRVLLGDDFDSAVFPGEADDFESERVVARLVGDTEEAATAREP